MTRRVDRINGVLRQEISQLLARQLRDPRLSGVVSITQVETSSDLLNARVFVSVLGGKEEKDTVLRGINSAKGYVQRELGGRLPMRHVPRLTFLLDDSLDRADRVYDLINRLTTDQPSQDGDATAPEDQ